MILLARHGETPSNVERRFQGQAPVGLTEKGVAQAHELAAAAEGRGIVALYTSPLPRARLTAEIVGARLGLPLREDPRLMEHDVGRWTGVLMDEVERDEPEAWNAYHATDPDFRFPGGESLRELMERVIEAMVDITQRGDLPALVVAHRGVIRSARSHTHIRGLETFMDWEAPNGGLVPL